MSELDFTPLSSHQVDTLFQQGYLVLKNIFDASSVRTLRSVADGVIQSSMQDRTANSSQSYHNATYYNIHDTLRHTTRLDFLMDSEAFFPAITQLMGPFIQMMGMHVFVRHPVTDRAQRNNIMRFHTDSGPAIQRIFPSRDSLPLQLKIQIFLTDVAQPYAGNFTVIPGSHLKKVDNYSPYCLVDSCNDALEQGDMPPGAKQLLIQSGDAVIHMLNLWHAVSENHSSHTRKSISLRYGQLWFRQYYSYLTDDIISRLSPRQRRLVGVFDESRGDVFYRPPDDQAELMMGDLAKHQGWI